MKIFFRNFILNIIYRFFCIINFSKRGVLLYQGSGDFDVFGNISAIKQYLDKINYKYTLVYRPKSVIEMINFLYLLSSSKVFVFDSQNPCAYIHKHKTIFINCWHAVGAYKKLGYDAIINKENNKKEIKRVTRVFRGIDYWICSSELQATLYSKSTNYSLEKFLPLGIPRTDLAHINQANKKEKYIILYAPTFRGREKRFVPPPFNIKNLKSRLGDNVVFAYRCHPTSPKNEIEGLGWMDFDDLSYAELLNKVDLVITDYSSIIFDFALANKPFILYVPDLEEYVNIDHPLYFLPTELTSLSVKKICDLENLLVKFISIMYNNNNNNNNTYYCSNIVKSLINSCNGNATCRVCNFIIGLSKKE